MQRLVPTSRLGLAARALSLPFKKLASLSPAPPPPAGPGPGFRPVRRIVPTSSLGLALRARTLPVRSFNTPAGTPSPSPVSTPAAAVHPKGLPPVAEDLRGVNQATWLLTVARSLNRALAGKINVTAKVTLTPNATSTVLFDSRIGAFSHVMLSPQSASAATALASGSLFIVPTTGQATIYHPSGANGDQTFSVLILG